MNSGQTDPGPKAFLQLQENHTLSLVGIIADAFGAAQRVGSPPK